MNDTQDHNTRTKLRLQLLKHGYTPLPNIEKRPGIPAWQKVEPTKELVRQWGRQQKTLTTGIRLDGGLIAFDFDIDDPEVENLCEELLIEFPFMAGALMRTGGGHKEAWFVRCTETFSRITSFSFEDRHVEEKGAVLEVFGGSSPRQFGAFGPHSEGVKYLWYDERSPATVPLSELVEIDKAAVFAIVDFTSAWMRASGFKELTHVKAGECESARNWVLTDEMTFVTQSGDMTLEELRAAAPTSCSMSWLDGEIAKSLSRGLVSIDHNGGVCICDTRDFITHHEARFKPSPLGGTEEQRAAFNALRESAGRPIEPSMRVDMSVEARASELLVRYAYMPSRDMAVLIENDDPQDGQEPMKGFRTVNSRWARRLPEESRPITALTAMVNPVDFWVCHPELVILNGLAYHPARPRPIYLTDTGRTIKNYFRPPKHDAAGGTAEPFLRFFEGLIPDESECTWALDAIAYKALHPEIPTPAVLLVDELGGIGKGILFDILVQLMGERNAGTLPRAVIFGGSNLANYKGDWGARVLHCIEELPSVSEATQKEQHATYNRLKELVDPRPRTEIMPVKYGKPIEVYVCATYWMAANHVDALPIPPEDRRIVVLTCGAQRSKKYYRSVVAWWKVPANIAALYRWLAARDLSDFDSTYAPPTQAKTEMIEATRYGSEVIVSQWLENTVERLGGLPPFLTVHMVLNNVQGKDPVAFVGQTGTRRVSSALRRAGYRDPMHEDGRHSCRWRIKHSHSGEGEQEKVLQHLDSPYIVGRSTSPDSIKGYIIELTRMQTVKNDKTLADLNRLLITKVRIEQ